ncbi:hypothetical protein [Lactobacillus gallinarum]|uniref:hypothetical protein n=1 Tax=Lactobacillus gallinarum TaxID=52242 RepID=UPI00388D1F5B
MNKDTIDINSHQYETISSVSTCTSFEEAFEEGLNLLAKKDGFDLSTMKSPTLDKSMSEDNYQVVVKFTGNNTLIIKQTKLHSIEGMIELDVEWPQASKFAKEMVKSIKARHSYQTAVFFEVLPSIFNKLLSFKNKTYFSTYLYGDMLSMLKIYDLDYLKQNKAFNSLLKKKAQNIKTKYQKWLRNVDSKTGLQYLTNMIDGLDDNLLNKANFIDHLEIDTPASLKCSQQLTVTLNMLQNDWLAFATFKKLVNEDINQINSWDELIVGGLNMLVSVDPTINSALINLFLEDPKKGQSIANTLREYGMNQTNFPTDQEDYPLYDSILKKYHMNDGTNTISD